ncbi:hypothetical protein [Treponema pectinovorum]|uniref:hypothetical protein n=1 Tax=Treponema pectinovorum TaxID=164 RepID=UPI003D9196B9
MNSPKKTVLFFFTAILSLIFLFFFRTKPQSQLWKGYNLLYVKSQVLSDENVISLLEKNDCKNVVCKVNQKIPVVSPLAPVQIELEKSYILKRNSFFTDSSSSFSIFYVPQRYLTGLKNAILEINGYSQTFASADFSNSSFAFAPFILLIFFGFLLYFSKLKKYFVLTSLPFIFFSFFRPFFTTVGASAIALFAFFLLEKLYERKDFLKLNKNTFFILLLLFLPGIFLSLSSFVNSALYLICIFSCTSLLLFYLELKKVFFTYAQDDSEPEFNFVFIKPSSKVNILKNKKKSRIILSALVFVLIFLIFSYKLLNFNFTSDSNTQRPLLPSPVEKFNRDFSLPNFEDFLDWAWIKISFPYRKLEDNEKISAIKKGESVKIVNFEENDEGIFEKVETVLTYDSSFISQICDRIEKIEYPALEKLMLQQGKKTSYGYTANSGKTSEKSAMLVLIFMTFIPLTVLLYCLSGKIKNGFGS